MDALEKILATYPHAQVVEITHTVDDATFDLQKSKLEKKQSYGGAVGLVWLDDSTVVLTKRSGLHAGWALIGGTVENSEPFDAAFLREVLEESGIEAVINSLPLIEKKTFINSRGDQINMLLAVFEATANPSQKVLVTEGAIAEGLEVAAFSLDDLPEEMILLDKEKLNLLIKQQNIE